MKKHQHFSWRQEALSDLAKHLNSFSHQHPAIFVHLNTVIEPEECVDKDDFIYTPKKVFNKAYYVYRGYVVVSKDTAKEERQVIGIYGRDSIISNKSFDARTASGLHF